LEKERIPLRDGTLIYGHENEYITEVIKSTRDYYEIRDLKFFSKYVPNEPIIYDIGSNIGNHTIYFLKYYRAKKVFAFEPVPENADLLELNMRVNGFTNVEIIRSAVGSRIGHADIIVNKQNMGGCKIIENPEGEIGVVSLDKLKLDKPDFIKIDVEGFEIEVLKGMTDLLQLSSPVIWIEINNHFHEVDEFFENYSYELIAKLNFNHIYIKCDNEQQRMNVLREFKKNIVLELNQTVLDKWHLSSRLLAERKSRMANKE